MEIKLILTLVRRWAWLLALGLILGAAAAYVISINQTPVYQASAKIMVFQSPDSGLSDLTTLNDQELISTYIELLRTRSVLEETSRVLGFPVTGGQIDAGLVSGTRLVQVTARDNNPERAAIIANEVVRVLIDQNEALQSSRFSDLEESYLRQIAQIEEQIALLTVNEAQLSEDTLLLLQQQLDEQQQELEDDIFALLSQISELELEIESLTSPLEAPGDLPPVLEDERQDLDDEILALQSKIITLESEIERASETDEVIQKRIELAQTQLQLDRASQTYDTLFLSGRGIGQLSDSQREELSGKRTELAQVQFKLTIASQVYNALLQPRSDSQSGGTVSDGADQQQAVLALYQQIYSTLLSNYEAVRLARLQNTPSIVPVEPAVVDSRPVTPRIVTNMALGAVLGLMIMGGIAFLIEYLDDSVKTPDQIAQILGLPVVSYVMNVRGMDKAEKKPYVFAHPHSQVAEAYRILKTNIELAGNDKPLKSIMITSPGTKDGKTTVASNLAVMMARGRRRTILIDCDLRKPKLHDMMSLPNDVGLSDLLRGASDLSDTMINWKNSDMLGVITSGTKPTNPAELLSSPEMSSLMNQIEESADYVIFDAPPFVVADASILAAKVDGVILVLRPGHTSINSARGVLEQLNRSGANTIGVVFNRIPPRRREYLGGYQQYYSSAYFDQK